MTNVQIKNGSTTSLITVQSTTGPGAWQFKDSPFSSYQAVVQGSGTVSATINIEVSNDGLNVVGTLLGTITLSGTTSASDGFTTQAPWKYVRANVTAISGTSANVTVTQSV